MPKKPTGVTKNVHGGDVSWTARASKRLPNGERLFWRETFASQAEAVQARAAWIANAQEVTDTQVTLGHALETWRQTHVTPPLSVSTRYRYNWILDHYLVGSDLARMPLSRINRGTVQDWYNALAVPPSARVHIHMVLGMVFDLAVAHGRIESNPARGCTVPRMRSTRGVALTREQVQAFLEYADQDRFRAFWRLALNTGLRRSELYGLRWSDVNWRTGALTVQHTVVHIGHREEQDRTKNPTSRRRVRLDGDTLAALQVHQAQQSAAREAAGDRWRDHDLVFCTRWGTPFDASGSIWRHFKELLAQAGLPHTVRLHDLRHTHMTWLLNQKVPLATVARRGGYANPNVLLQIYAHTDDEQDGLAADVAGRLTETGLKLVQKVEDA